MYNYNFSIFNCQVIFSVFHKIPQPIVHELVSILN